LAIYTLGSTGARYTDNMKFELREPEETTLPNDHAVALFAQEGRVHGASETASAHTRQPRPPLAEVDLGWIHQDNQDSLMARGCKTSVSEVSLPVFYQTKDGEWDSLLQSKKDRYLGKGGIERLIDNRDAAQAYIALARDDELLNPVQARRMRTAIFDITEDTYEDVFPDSPRSPFEFLVPYLFLTYVETRNSAIRKELAKIEPKSDEEQALYGSRNSLRYAKWFIMGIIGWLVRHQYKSKELDPKAAELLASDIGDFAGPRELGNIMLNFAFDLIEEYSAFCVSQQSTEEEQPEEEFDPALAYRQAPVWKDLKQYALTRYRRQVSRKELKVELFPTLG
jgi:hypothetical protein